MKEHIAVIALGLILIAAAFGAYQAKRGADMPPIIVNDLIIVVDNGEDAAAVLEIMQDMMVVE